MSTYVYDLEVFQNFFSATFRNTKDRDDKKVFYCFDEINQTKELLTFVRECKYLVGYNNSKYDDLLMSYLEQNKMSVMTDSGSTVCMKLYQLSVDIISTQTRNGGSYPDSIRKLMWKNTYKSIDLMKMLGFDKLGIGLKQVSINLRWHRIQDLPLPYNAVVTKDQIDLILDYNDNDVQITWALNEKCRKEFENRWTIGNAYKVDLLNSSNSNMGDRLLNKLYSDATEMELSEFKDLRTKRSIVAIKDLLSDKISFQTKEFNAMYEIVKRHVIDVTKADEEAFEEKRTKKKGKGLCKLIYNGKRYTIALGGLHSDNPPAIYRSNVDVDIITADVASYYPNLIINEVAVPEHLGQTFLDVYKQIIQDRIQAKRELGSKSPKAEALKIAANAVYGKLNFAHYWLYDPAAAYKVTMNGQMYLLMLIESLELAGIECIVANTDGIECRVKKDQKDTYDKICKDWENLTGLELEYDIYKDLIVRDVNNYISVTTKGKIKEKGAYLTTRSQISLVDELKRAFDCPIVAEAVHRHLINGESVETVLKDHTDVMDFCMSQKAGNQFTIELHSIRGQDLHIEQLQKTNRYFISTTGGALLKRNKETGELTNMASGWYVTLYNDVFDVDLSTVDYGYYIAECNKLINSVTNNNQMSIFDLI